MNFFFQFGQVMQSHAVGGYGLKELVMYRQGARSGRLSVWQYTACIENKVWHNWLLCLDSRDKCPVVEALNGFFGFVPRPFGVEAEVYAHVEHALHICEALFAAVVLLTVYQYGPCFIYDPKYGYARHFYFC